MSVKGAAPSRGTRRQPAPSPGPPCSPGAAAEPCSIAGRAPGARPRVTPRAAGLRESPRAGAHPPPADPAASHAGPGPAGAARCPGRPGCRSRRLTRLLATRTLSPAPTSSPSQPLLRRSGAERWVRGAGPAAPPAPVPVPVPLPVPVPVR